MARRSHAAEEKEERTLGLLRMTALGPLAILAEQTKNTMFGLYDMFGNVPEWTEDSWHDGYKGAPSDGTAWKGGGSPQHTLRGGGWDLPAFFLHAALRGRGAEVKVFEDNLAW